MSKEKQKQLTIALDLEGTLISNAVSQFPRPRLFIFLEYCHQNFVGGSGAFASAIASRFETRLVIFTAVNEVRFRSIYEKVAILTDCKATVLSRIGCLKT